MNQPVAVAYSKEDIHRMAEPTVAAARRSAKRRSLAVMIVGVAVALISLQQHWLSDENDWVAVSSAFLYFCILPAGVVRHYALEHTNRLPALMKHGAVRPARFTDARNVGANQRVDVTWDEGGKPAKGYIEIAPMLGYMQRDTTVLVGTSKYVAVVLNERVYLGQR